MSPAKKPAKKDAARSRSASAGGSRTGKAAKKTVSPKKSVAKKPAAKKTAAKKTTAKKTAAKKTVAPKKPVAKKSTAKKTAAKKTVAKKTTAPVAKKSTARPQPRKTKAPARSGAASSAPRSPRPAKLDAKQLAAIRERLLQERAELLRQQSELDAEGTQGETAEAGLDDDFADAGTATFDRERDLSIRNNITDLIDQITRAVSRIDEGTYGTCERCGRPIDAARLKALPHALLCLDCKRREERGR
ncbi:MAG TPA: TraR/DksA C4-type zinc finger protein [Actinomycetota bacterium]|nr:TraR/DksA C4-type zinc finger protein [Actinomycetota bacterium]